MKKFLVLILALIMMLSLVALVACDTDKDTDTDGNNDTDTDTDKDPVVTTGSAYGLVHTSYVGMATVTFTDDELTGATLDEMCTPLWKTASEASEYTTTVGTKHYYTTFSVGELATFTHNGTTYVLADDTTLLEWLADADNCESYVDTVVAGELTVETGDTDTVLTADELQKSLNGYWSGDNYPLGWTGNVEATIAYVLEYGFEADDFAKDSDNNQTDNNGIVTGATWNDMADYYFLLADAADSAVVESDKDMYVGMYSYTAYGTTYGVKVLVTLDADGKIATVELVSDDITGWVSLSDAYPDYGWTEEDRELWLDAVDELLESFVGLTAQDIASISATISGVVGDSDSVDGGYNVSGATQSAARVVLALQNALCDGPSGVVSQSGDPVTADGTYTGTDKGSFSEFNVTVVVDGGVITSVTVADSSTTNTNWSDKVTAEALTALYNSVIGMTAAEVLEATTTTGFISGATDTSSTFLAAVANALTIA